MKIKMKSQITGTRDGVAWPAPGGEIDLPEYEAAKLIRAGDAVAVGEDKSGPGRPRKTPDKE